ncbi:MAG: type II toxin-antitoxin system VapB family antitoxin [Rhodobacteraceae bacterium]|nr:type II toxin-antitoxin system VapB family antitoxin [Paracoccaceae bacterium]
MGLNIKSDEACRPACEQANLTGDTETAAITVALRAIIGRCTRLMGPGTSAVEYGDMLYDGQGLPN